MNKYFKEFADKQGWKTDDNMAYGMCGGYPVSVTLGTMFYIVFGCSPNDKAAELKEYIHKKNLNAVVGNFMADKQAFSFTLSALTMKSAMSKLEDVLNKVSAKLREFGVKENICPFCMEPLEENVVGVRIGTAYFKAHDKCADVLVKECAEESEKKKVRRGQLSLRFFGRGSRRSCGMHGMGGRVCVGIYFGMGRRPDRVSFRAAIR